MPNPQYPQCSYRETLPGPDRFFVLRCPNESVEDLAGYCYYHFVQRSAVAEDYHVDGLSWHMARKAAVVKGE